MAQEAPHEPSRYTRAERRAAIHRARTALAGADSALAAFLSLSGRVFSVSADDLEREFTGGPRRGAGPGASTVGGGGASR